MGLCERCGQPVVSRLTASPKNVGTLWVQETAPAGKSVEVLLRPAPLTENEDAAAGSRGGWLRMSRNEWAALRDTVDKYIGALTEI